MRAILFMTLALAACAMARTPVNTIPVTFGKTSLYVEIAANEQARAHGLMFRNTLAEDQGMIFVFDEAEAASFWMKNTPLPLSIAFLGDDKTILNIDEMAPQDDKTFHKSKGLARYAVEANKGWFASHGIKAGDKADFTLP